MTKAHSLRTLAILTCCLLLASGAFAAEMVGFGDGASWNLDKANHGGMLTITGPAGFSMQKAFDGYSAPTFSMWDKAGYALPDGQYNWHITLNAAKLERGDAAGQKAGSFSGTFRIENSSMLVPKAAGFAGDTDGFTKDQQILDDLIVDGSACIGQDCVNGESFGFDTLRLKENNLRIKFDDTSNSASFPNFDWQLTANDSINGGANKFSIDDVTSGRTPFTIEGSAPSNALYVDDGGQIGLGTSAPVVQLHVKDGNTPTLRLEQDGSSGFTAQTWDVAGNEANFFIRDATNGSQLPIQIKPGADTASLFIAANNNVGVGNSSPNAPLHVLRGGSSANTGFGTQVATFQNNASAGDGAIVSLIPGTTGTAQITFGEASAPADDRILFDNNANVLRFRVAGTDVLEADSSAVTILSTCIQMDTLACTASNGAGFSCVTGSC